MREDRKDAPDLDLALVIKAQEGDRHAFDELMHKHQDRIYKVALSMMKSPADAEEVVQQTFLSAFEKLDGFRRESAFFSWVYRVAMNHCLMRLRKKRPQLSPQRDVEEPDADEGVFSAQYVSPYDMVLSHEVTAAIDAAVASLSEEMREVLYLRMHHGLRNQEIADELGITLPNVKSRLHRARQHVKDALADAHLRSGG